MSHCRSGCPTQDHQSYIECLRDAGIRVAYCDSVNGWDATKQRNWDRELSDYRGALKEGMEPLGTDRRSIDSALRISDETGVAFKG